MGASHGNPRIENLGLLGMLLFLCSVFNESVPHGKLNKGAYRVTLNKAAV